MPQNQSNLGIKFAYPRRIDYTTDMKKILLFTFLIGAVAFAKAQSNYHDLLELIVDEKYDRCLLKAMKYMDSDKTSKDALPYVYASMAYYRIYQSDDEDLKTKFEKPIKYTVKYLEKFRKKDKENEFVAEFEDYISEVRQTVMEEAERELSSEKYTRAKSHYKNLTDIDEQDPGAWLMLAYTYQLMRSTKDARDSFEKTKEIINTSDCTALKDEQKDLLKRAIILTAEMLDETGDRSAAKEWLEIGAPLFSEDKEYNVTYKMIVG
ncbi:MAG: hypothetical protein ACI80P_000638 [Flavobacteriales bacterium]|jgi:hypothetical protein